MVGLIGSHTLLVEVSRPLDDGGFGRRSGGTALTMAGIELRSPSFGDHQPIPARHAKDHDNLSPALRWTGVPEAAVELAVLCEDPDAPRGTFIHWVLAGLEPTATGLAEGEHPGGAVEGRNDFGEEGYGGPMPPVGDGPHRYFFRLYAASAPLELVAGASADNLRRALEGKELASGTLVGTYQR
jgi:Raf kinase inhibitor-like YbhB/YbcL family protein